MKKTIIIVTILMLIMGLFLCTNQSYAGTKAIDDTTESKIIEIKENATNSLEDYKEKYRFRCLWTSSVHIKYN